MDFFIHLWSSRELDLSCLGLATIWQLVDLRCFAGLLPHLAVGTMHNPCTLVRTTSLRYSLLYLPPAASNLCSNFSFYGSRLMFDYLCLVQLSKNLHRPEQKGCWPQVGRRWHNLGQHTHEKKVRLSAAFAVALELGLFARPAWRGKRRHVSDRFGRFRVTARARRCHCCANATGRAGGRRWQCESLLPRVRQYGQHVTLDKIYAQMFRLQYLPCIDLRSASRVGLWTTIDLFSVLSFSHAYV